MADIHVGDYGTVIEIQVLEDGLPVNISQVEDIWLVFHAPDGGKIIKKKSENQLELVDNGTTGKFQFTATEGFWKEGFWAAYPVIIVKTGEQRFRGTQINWRVLR